MTGPVEQRIRADGGNDSAAFPNAAVASMHATLTVDQADSEEVCSRADAIGLARSIPFDQSKQFAQYEKQYTDAVSRANQQATDAAQTATRAFSASAILAVIALAVGAIAPWMGGAVGPTHVPRDEVYVTR